jgi:ABC-type glycerol-3-phosphate transport system permease component
LQAVLSFNAIWSDYMWPLIVIPTNQNHWTLPLGLVKFYSVNNANFGVLSAGLCIITLPVILFYTFFSKYFIEGVSMGAVKG